MAQQDSRLKKMKNEKASSRLKNERKQLRAKISELDKAQGLKDEKARSRLET